MKNLFTSIIFIMVFSVFTYAQNCKPDKDINDKFTKQKEQYWNYELKGTWNMLLDISTSTTFSFCVINGNQLCGVLTFIQEAPQSQHDLQPLKIGKGNKLFIANDNESVELICQSDAISKNTINIINSNIKQTFIAQFNITTGDLEKFSQNLFNQVLITFDGTPGKKADIKQKVGNKIKEDATCLKTIFQNSKNNQEKDASSTLPRNESTNKYSFEEVVNVNETTQQQLYERAKKWMINYYKSTQINIDNPNDGELSRSGSFIKLYKKANGNDMESNDHFYNISILLKDGKYKYTLTDIVLSDGKDKMPLEPAFDMLNKLPGKTKEVDEKITEGVTEIINNLKTAMQTDSQKSKSDW